MVQTVLDQLPQERQEIIDLGTGCGVIALTLAHLRPNWQLFAIDISQEALKIAHFNAENLNIPNVQFLQSNWLQTVTLKPVDAIIGNPPYIRSWDAQIIHGEIPFEPTISLSAGPTGFEAFQTIVGQCKPFLKTRGLIAFEHGIDQAPALSELLVQAGFADLQTFNDAAGNTRVTIGRLGSRSHSR